MTVGNRPQAPLFVTVNVTTKCNLDCMYCYMQPRSNIDMEPKNFERIIDELSNKGVFLITLSGGEPFLHPQFPDLFRYAHQRFRHVITLTNGTAMRNCHFEAIQQVLDQKWSVTIQVSLDSYDPSVNTITRTTSLQTVQTIAKLTDMGCHVIVAMVVTRHNVTSMISSINALSAHTRWFHLMTVQDVRSKLGVERELEADREVRALLWKDLQFLAESNGLFINLPIKEDCEQACATGAPCMAGFSHFVIDPDLMVRPCDRLTDVILGNLSTNTVAEVWNSAETHALIQGLVPKCQSL